MHDCPVGLGKARAIQSSMLRELIISFLGSNCWHVHSGHHKKMDNHGNEMHETR